jgi:hypothetical protein
MLFCQALGVISSRAESFAGISSSIFRQPIRDKTQANIRSSFYLKPALYLAEGIYPE